MTWILCQDQLPRPHASGLPRWVIVARPGETLGDARFTLGSGWRDATGRRVYDVTHWMPMPPPPEHA